VVLAAARHMFIAAQPLRTPEERHVMPQHRAPTEPRAFRIDSYKHMIIRDQGTSYLTNTLLPHYLVSDPNQAWVMTAVP